MRLIEITILTLQQCIRKTVPALLGVTLAGCVSVGPDYQGPPETFVMQSWNHQLGFSTDSMVEERKWWTQLNDELLNQLIHRAVENNIDIKIAIARVHDYSSDADNARAYKAPQVNSNGFASRSQTNESSEVITGLPPRTDNVEAIAGIASWEIDFFGRIARQVEAADAQYQLTVEQYRDVLVSLLSNVANTYINVRSIQSRISIARRNVSNQQGSFKLVNSRYKAELVSQLDVYQAEQNLESSKANIPQLEAALNVQMNKLAILLGETPGTLHHLLRKQDALPNAPERFAVKIPREVIRQRPDIRAAEKTLALNTALIGVTAADLYPRLSLNGLFGFANSSGTLVTDSSNFWSVSPQFSWNIFDAGVTRNRIKQAEIKTKQARLAYQNTVLNAFMEVENNLRSFQEENRRLASLNKSVELAKKAVSIAKSQYRSGLSSFQSVLDAERIVFLEEDKLAVSQATSIHNLIAIYRAMGGGWSSVDSQISVTPFNTVSNEGI